MARDNNMPALTDQKQSYGMVGGWTVETLADVLLSGSIEHRSPATTDVASQYVALALETVVPDGLEQIPVERIVQARKELAGEFYEFRKHLDTLNDTFAEIAKIEDPMILQAQLGVLVEQYLRVPTADLEHGLRRLNLNPVKAVLGMTSVTLPPVVAWAPSELGLPAAVGAGGMVAATLIGSAAKARAQARADRRSAAGYLLSLRRTLTPENIVDRTRHLFSRAVAPGRPPHART